MIDDHDRCEWVNVSSGTRLTRVVPDKIRRATKRFVCVCVCVCMCTAVTRLSCNSLIDYLNVCLLGSTVFCDGICQWGWSDVSHSARRKIQRTSGSVSPLTVLPNNFTIYSICANVWVLTDLNLKQQIINSSCLVLPEVWAFLVFRNTFYAII